MLTVYYARENINKEKFMYDRIGETLSSIMDARISHSQNSARSIPKRVLLIVPEQFTLQAERNAFEYLCATGFIDLDVLSTSSLSRRLYSELGGDSGAYINKYGKYMLIAKLLYNKKRELLTFRGLENSTEFAGKLDDMITELKMFNVSPDALNSIADNMPEEDLLGRKLKDVAKIYEGYEETLSSNSFGESLQDTADQIKNLSSMIVNSKFISESEVWFTGFDYFSPAMKEMISELTCNALSVGLILTADPDDAAFKLTNSLMNELNAEQVEICSDDSRYVQLRPPEMSFIERVLFSFRQNESRTFDSETDYMEKVLTFVEAGNFHSEAETAAAKIVELIRDEGYKYKDILVLCNDLDKRGQVIKRVFKEYGLPIFIDQRRSIEHNPILEFILALPDIVSGGRKHEDVFKLLKTGLTEISRDEFEELENYVLRYKIRGKQWDREFTYGLINTDENNKTKGSYSEIDMASLNESRKKISSLLLSFEKSYKEGSTAKGKSESILDFIINHAKLPDKIEEFTQRLEEEDFNEYAAEMSAVWSVVTEIFNQMITILGDMPMSRTEYSTVLRMGFESIMIGMLPTAKDQIVLGTMQRTRTGEVDAIFVLGANDGVLPSFSGNNGILNDDEMKRLEERDTFVGRRDEAVVMEEQLAIYRNLSKSKRKLYLSYSVSGADEKDMRPAIIFKQLRKMFPDVPLEKDIVNKSVDEDISLIQSPGEGIVHLTERAISALNNGEDTLSDVWSDTWSWLEKSDDNKDRLQMVRKGLSFKNRKEKANSQNIIRLLNRSIELHEDVSSKEINTSPSALENFSKCPFSWFLSRGLRLAERRIFEIDSRNMGDMYHYVLMQYGREMSNSDLPISDTNSKWNTISREESERLVNDIYEEVSREYDEGLLKSGGYEKYKSDRMTEVLFDVAWAITEQVRDGKIQEMLFETTFDMAGDFSPITFDSPEGKVNIRGQIDRLDVLEGNYALITDYKSGSDKINLPDIRSGWQLQLMTYLTAVSEKYIPAGVNYFHILEPHIKDEGKDIEEETKKKYTPNSYIVDNPSINSSIGFDYKSAEKEEFDGLRMTVKEILEKLCEEMIGGNIEATPMTAKKKSSTGAPMSACTYCAYSGICNYDKIFD